MYKIHKNLVTNVQNIQTIYNLYTKPFGITCNPPVHVKHSHISVQFVFSTIRVKWVCDFTAKAFWAKVTTG